MYSAIRKLQEKRANGEEGFTLIELLVVIIIIGILAAIAIPVFLNQRTKGWNAAAQSDARNMAISQEAYYTSNGAYTNVVANLTAEGFRQSSTVSAVGAFTDSGNYCMYTVSQSRTVYRVTNTNTTPVVDAGGVPADYAECIA